MTKVNNRVFNKFLKKKKIAVNEENTYFLLGVYTILIKAYFF